jgi:hypothetical protein
MTKWPLCALLLATPALAEPCPAPVTKTVEKAFPKGKIESCKKETEHGKEQYEVKVARADGTKAEAEVAPDGTLIKTEEKIAIDKVPAAVTKAFAAKYPKAKIDAAEKQVAASGAVTYELAFKVDGKTKEATFAADGKFIEEE